MTALRGLLSGNAAVNTRMAVRWISSVAAESGFSFPASLARKGVAPRRDPGSRNVQWVFLGCPGVGKGTYASRLSRLLGVPHIATGDLVRDELAATGPLSKQCGGNFNVASIDIKGENGRPGISMPPLLPPEHCMSKLVTRADDTEEVVKERLRLYYELSQPVEEFYRVRGKLLEFDLPGGIPESWPKLLQALNLDDHDEKQSAAA
ncbi:hypothetical protein BHM03_00045250 [Ensete ventricosum]|nr:hypothetical protein BHM03_00045250 [Ensete ventricosum]